MKVLLVQPNYGIQRKTGMWGINQPLGLCYMAAILEKNDIEVKIIDANALNLSESEVSRKARNYDVVGIGFDTPAKDFSASVISSLPSDTLKIAGGSHPTIESNEVLNLGFDIAVRKEGEFSLLEICKGMDLKAIKGISFKKQNRIINNPERPWLANLDLLPFPARHLLPNNGVNFPYKGAGTRYRPWTNFITSRGCPYDCYYCNKFNQGYTFRPRSPDNIIEELLMLKEKYNIKELDICDECFNMDIERANKIFDLISENNLDLHIRFSNGIRANKINREFMRKAARAGVEYVAYGIESGNQKILNSLPKRLTISQIKKAVKLAQEEKLTVAGFFILGLLGDTKKTMRQTVDFAKSLNLDYVAFNIATPYPGTRMWNKIKENGSFRYDTSDIFHHTSGKLAFEYPDMSSPEEVEEIYNNVNKEFYLRPKVILKRLTNMRTLDDVKMIIRAAKILIEGKK